jgi:hypothetical protein
MATHFGFFTVIPGTDTPISLTHGGDIDHDLTFHLPSDTTRDLGFLTYMTDAASPNNLTYTMKINDHPVAGHRVDSTVLHMEQEVVGSFRPGDNKLQISLTGGTGTLVISDMVLHYVRFS